MSGHAGKRTCEGLRNEECGKLKTLTNLDYCYKKYSVENNSKKSNILYECDKDSLPSLDTIIESRYYNPAFGTPS